MKEQTFESKDSGSNKTMINAKVKMDTKEVDKAIKKTKKLIRLLKKANRLSQACEVEREELNYLRDIAERECNQNILEQAESLSSEISSKRVRKLIEEEKDKIRQGQYPEWEYVFGGVYNSQKRILRAALKELL